MRPEKVRIQAYTGEPVKLKNRPLLVAFSRRRFGFRGDPTPQTLSQMLPYRHAMVRRSRKPARFLARTEDPKKFSPTFGTRWCVALS